MQLVKVTLTNVEPPGQRITESVATDLIWSYAQENDAVEHVRVRIGTDLMTVVLFIRSADEKAARESAANVVRRAMKAPALQGWRINE
ncbi:hypothetical protein [Catellatospora sp. NPDC049609]|uniref:hypothetical protein n=1 Tax=Catellatospora sp. NPDC049609 TaxID=3155505 RepID=UPI0034137C32